MMTVLKLKKNFLTGLIRPIRFTSTVSNSNNTALNKANSLAYLAYKNRKRKGLIANDSQCPTVYFGDEWAL